jgi:hypothetical protein
MARVSVEVPAELVAQVRETVFLLYQATAESLHAALKSRADEERPVEEIRSHRLRVDELDDLVRQLDGEPREVEIAASGDLLHDVLYGALIDAGERLGETSNQAWRGELPLERVQESAEEVLALDALLRGLGLSPCR